MIKISRKNTSEDQGIKTVLKVIKIFDQCDHGRKRNRLLYGSDVSLLYFSTYALYPPQLLHNSLQLQLTSSHLHFIHFIGSSPSLVHERDKTTCRIKDHNSLQLHMVMVYGAKGRDIDYSAHNNHVISQTRGQPLACLCVW